MDGDTNETTAAAAAHDDAFLVQLCERHLVRRRAQLLADPAGRLFPSCERLRTSECCAWVFARVLQVGGGARGGIHTRTQTRASKHHTHLALLGELALQLRRRAVAALARFAMCGRVM